MLALLCTLVHFSFVSQKNVCAERCRHHRRRDAFGDRAAVQAVRPGHAEDAQPHHHHRRHQDHLAASAAHALAGCSRAARPSPLLVRAAAGAPRAQREAAPQRQPRGREGRPAAALPEAFHGQGGAGSPSRDARPGCAATSAARCAATSAASSRSGSPASAAAAGGEGSPLLPRPPSLGEMPQTSRTREVQIDSTRPPSDVEPPRGPVRPAPEPRPGPHPHTPPCDWTMLVGRLAR